MRTQGKVKKIEIGTRQSACIIANTTIGAGVLTLPRNAAELAKQSGWFAVVLATVFAMVLVSVMTLLIQRFPKLSMVEYTREILSVGNFRFLGRVLSIPVLAGFLLFWGAGAVLSARLFGEVVVTTLLPMTPLEVIIGTMLLTSFVLALYNIEVLARVNELLLPLIAVALFLIAVSSFQHAKDYHLFPLREDISWDVLCFTVFQVFSPAFLGFEVILLFSEYIRQSPDLMRSHVGGVLIPGFLYTLITISGIAVFGSNELEILMWPTMDLVKVTEVPGLILERIESAFIGVWVAAVFTTTGNFYFSVCLMVKKIFGLKSQRLVAVILLPVFYWVSLRPSNIYELLDHLQFAGMIGTCLVIVIPLLLLVLAWIQKKGLPKSAVPS